MIEHDEGARIVEENKEKASGLEVRECQRISVGVSEKSEVRNEQFPLGTW